jgi:hypothetical protein
MQGQWHARSFTINNGDWNGMSELEELVPSIGVLAGTHKWA